MRGAKGAGISLCTCLHKQGFRERQAHEQSLGCKMDLPFQKCLACNNVVFPGKVPDNGVYMRNADPLPVHTNRLHAPTQYAPTRQ